MQNLGLLVIVISLSSSFFAMFSINIFGPLAWILRWVWEGEFAELALTRRSCCVLEVRIAQFGSEVCSNSLCHGVWMLLRFPEEVCNPRTDALPCDVFWALQSGALHRFAELHFSITFGLHTSPNKLRCRLIGVQCRYHKF